jgi:electron transfer flavoprotein alpha subunit
MKNNEYIIVIKSNKIAPLFNVYDLDIVDGIS